MKTLDELKKDFGAFYPTGYMVVGFSEPSERYRQLAIETVR